MNSETVTLEQAILKLSEANSNNATRLTDLENKLKEMQLAVTEQQEDATNNLQDTMTNQIETITTQTREWQDSTTTKLQENQEQWNHITQDVKDMRAELKKICEALTNNQNTNNENNSPIDDNLDTTDTNHNTLPNNELSNYSQATQQNTTSHTTHTIIIPPSSAIPIFSGNISENPRQFLIRLEEYAQTINQWNNQSLLNGISQFLRNTALEWYCQLRTSHRRPQTWKDFVNQFLNQFNSPMRRAKQEQLWKNCKQEENETINEFIVRLRALWREQKPNETEDDLIRHLMCKIRNNLLTMIGVSRCESLDEIVTEAQKFEEILYQRSKQQDNNNIKQETFRHYTSSAQQDDDGEQYEVQAMSAYQNYRHATAQSNTNNRRYRQTTNELRCYLCQMKGHKQQNCPYQYNTYQNQRPRYYSKNDNGAHGGRDYVAPS